MEGKLEIPDCKNKGEYQENLQYRPLQGIKSVFKKLKNNEKLSAIEKQCLSNFVDAFTTVSTNKNVVGEDVSKIASEVNKHAHTKSCRKYDTQCRFQFPKYPSTRTIIAEPISGVTESEKKALLKEQKDVLRKVGEVLIDDSLIEEIISTIGQSEHESKEVYKINKVKRIKLMLEKAGVTLEEYEKALSFTRVGYKVVQERDLTEISINSYNVEWLRAWNGNMDMQTCFDYHAVITYISDYFSKDDTGLMELIKEIIKLNTSESFKEQMKLVANSFLTHRQIGEAEAVYRLLPNMLLKNSNVACQWLEGEKIWQNDGNLLQRKRLKME